MALLIGREEEKATLLAAFRSSDSELVAVIGRWGVGKTFLVESVLDEVIDLQVTGTQNEKTKPQILNLHFLIERLTGQTWDKPANWREAFYLIINALDALPPVDRKRVLFFDELPWLASRRSGFLAAFSFFWNNYAVKNDLLVIICGSAASWMIQRVVDNRGGLHNRITRRIYLRPFTLREVELFFQQQRIRFNRRQIAQLYMVMGGIPHYLKEVRGGESAAQNIDRICFAESGLLRREFANLYPALFERAERHITVVRALGSKWQGLTRTELLRLTKFSDGGGLSKILRELDYSGFISAYYPLGKRKREKLFRLTDEYSLFYLKFIENKRNPEAGMWNQLVGSGTYHAWTGYAFESICLKHTPQLKAALQIAGIYSETSSLYFPGNDEIAGAQIDLLIDRADNCINLCEVKFTQSAFVITADYARQLTHKRAVLEYVTGNKKQIFVTLISAAGIAQNAYALDVVDRVLDIDALF